MLDRRRGQQVALPRSGIVTWLGRSLVLLGMALGPLSVSAQEGAAAVAPVASEEQAGALPVGGTVWISGTNGAGLRVHTAPRLESNILGLLSASAPVLVLEGPIAVEGAHWYRVSSMTLPTSGWVEGQFLVLTPPGQQVGSSVLPVGSTAWVSGTEGTGLLVHSAPLVTSQQIETLDDGTLVQVLEGPTVSGGTNWYRVGSTAQSASGWVDGQYLTSTPTGQPVSTRILPIGSSRREVFHG